MSSYVQPLPRQASVADIGPALVCDIATEFSKLEQIRSDWDRLYQLSSQPYVFQRFEWARAWWAAFGSRCRLISPVIYRGKDIVGILPLVLRGRRIEFLGSPLSDYNDIICDRLLAGPVLRVALDSLLSLRPRWNTARLASVRDDSNIISALRSLPLNLRDYIEVVPQSECPAIRSSFPKDVFAPLARKTSLRRHRKALGRIGALTFRQTSDAAEIKSYLPVLFKQHLDRFQTRSEFRDTAVQSFYYDLTDELAAKDQLRFAILELDSHPVALHLGFENNGRFLWYKPSFDSQFAHYGPGEVLLAELFDYGSARQLAEFDFTVGSEPYKCRFANFVAHTTTLHVLPRLIDRLSHRAVRATKEAVQRHPSLAQHLRRLVHSLPAA